MKKAGGVFNPGILGRGISGVHEDFLMPDGPSAPSSTCQAGDASDTSRKADTRQKSSQPELANGHHRAIGSMNLHAWPNEMCTEILELSPQAQF